MIGHKNRQIKALTEELAYAKQEARTWMVRHQAVAKALENSTKRANKACKRVVELETSITQALRATKSAKVHAILNPEEQA